LGDDELHLNSLNLYESENSFLIRSVPEESLQNSESFLNISPQRLFDSLNIWELKELSQDKK